MSQQKAPSNITNLQDPIKRDELIKTLVKE
jgi:hypothetical protein